MAAGPIVDRRDRAAVLAALTARLPGYTPEWKPRPGTPGHALLQIFARMIEIEIDGLNRMPARARLAFLDSLGNALLPAQSARAPLVFTLMETAPLDVLLPAGSQLAAKLPPPPPSLAGEPAPPTPPAPLFFVEQTVTLTRGKLAVVYSVDPDADQYRNHAADLTTGFTLFDRLEPVPHVIYLGHSQLFKIAGTAEIVLSFNLSAARGRGISRPLLVDWEYLSVDGWLPLTMVEDQTARLTQDGRITLHKTCGPDAKEDAVAGRQSCWVRGRVSPRTPSARIGPLPGGYQIKVKEPPALFAMPKVTVDGVTTANIIAVNLRVVVFDVPLPGAVPGAMLKNASTSAFVAEIAKVIDAHQLEVVGVDSGRMVTIAGASTSCVVGAEGEISVLAKPLVGASVIHNALILDAGTGLPLGQLDAAYPEFRVPVEDGRELLAGDVVTVDLASRSPITAASREMLFLDHPIGHVEAGNRIVLADGLAPLRHEGADEAGALPEIDVIRARVGFSKTGLVPDAAYTDTASVNVRNTFRPFGLQPTTFTTFYVASKEAFQRAQARIALLFLVAQPGHGYSTTGLPGIGGGKLDWTIEYYDGRRWTVINENQELHDETQRLTAGSSGSTVTLSFICPSDWSEIEVNGDKNLWLRIRIDSGNYGHPLQISVVMDGGTPKVVADPDTLAAPVVQSLTVQYTYYTNPDYAEYCLTENDFAFADHTEDARWPGPGFAPFVPVSDWTAAVHFGFTERLPAGLVSLFSAAATDDENVPEASPFIWEYFGARGWTELPVADETRGFARTGVSQFIGAPDALRLDGLGGSLYRIRARLKPGTRMTPRTVSGLWLNGVWARQGENVQNDTLGRSDGNPEQTLVFPPQRIPVMPGEVIEIREWTGRGDDWETALLGVPAGDIRFEIDPRDGVTKTAAWVRWQVRPHLLSSEPQDRHYTIERASGILRFGAPPFGMIPPAGARIVASYTSGGGLAGNVAADTITELRSGVGYVQAVTNPLAAAAGTATELAAVGRDRSTARLANRNRAVSAADYEWLAHEASPEVARVRCLPLDAPPGSPLRGWVTLLVVPQSIDRTPRPTPEFAERVLSYIRARVPAGVSSRLRIVPAQYVAVGFQAEIVIKSLDAVAQIEASVRQALARVLHPLTGGADARGYQFGDTLFLSDFAALLEGVEGVDFIRRLQLQADKALVGDVVTLPAYALPTEGDHALKLVVGGR